jgi:hypothetical protein
MTNLTHFSQCIYFTPLHVSSNKCSSSGGSNSVNTSSGIMHSSEWLSCVPVGTHDSHKTEEFTKFWNFIFKNALHYYGCMNHIFKKKLSDSRTAVIRGECCKSSKIKPTFHHLVPARWTIPMPQASLYYTASCFHNKNLSLLVTLQNTLLCYALHKHMIFIYETKYTYLPLGGELFTEQT